MVSKRISTGNKSPIFEFQLKFHPLTGEGGRWVQMRMSQPSDYAELSRRISDGFKDKESNALEKAVSSALVAKAIVTYTNPTSNTDEVKSETREYLDYSEIPKIIDYASYNRFINIFTMPEWMEISEKYNIINNSSTPTNDERLEEAIKSIQIKK